MKTTFTKVAERDRPVIACVRYNATGNYWYAEVYYSVTGRRVLYERDEGIMHPTHDLARREAEQIASRHPAHLVLWR